MSNPELERKYEHLRDLLRSYESVAVAFSGGLDSTLVLKVAVDVLGAQKVVAVTGCSPSLPRADLQEAEALARQFGVEHVPLATEEFTDPAYLANPADRCYYCKRELYAKLCYFAAERGLKEIVNGMNADDRGDYRPGTRAGTEQGIKTPAADAGLTKSDLRALARRFGLALSDKPASPCLASRLPYGESITPEKLHQVEQAEKFLRELGLRECRVRHHGDLARIEVPAEQITWLADPEHRLRIDAYLRELGYTYVALDLRGFRSGSLNEVLRVPSGVARSGGAADRP